MSVGKTGGLAAVAVATIAVSLSMSGGGQTMVVSAAPQAPAGDPLGGQAAGTDQGGDTCLVGGPLNDPRAQPYKALFISAGKAHGVDPQILAAIARKESNFAPAARNPSSGASGIMQFMPATARGLGVDPMSPSSAIPGAARLFADYKKQFGGSTELGLAAYNAGPVRVKKAGNAVPQIKETQDYVRTITGWLKTTTSCQGPSLPAGTPATGSAAKAMSWAQARVGGRYIFGGKTERGYDCSGFLYGAMKAAGVQGFPQTSAAGQDQWCARGNCTPVPYGREKPGDIFVWDSYLGPGAVGHIGLVKDPRTKKTVDARSTSQGIIEGSYANGPSKNIFRIWRPKYGV